MVREYQLPAEETIRKRDRIYNDIVSISLSSRTWIEKGTTPPKKGLIIYLS